MGGNSFWPATRSAWSISICCGRRCACTELSVVGYCLMSNHVHLVVIPRRAEALAEAFHQVHGRYAAYWNVAHASSGHVWQGRFYSCPMDRRSLVDGAALCGTESGARGNGGGGGGVAVVERRGALRQRPTRTPAWKWRLGAKLGPRPVGGSSWRREKPNPSCAPFDGRPTRDGRWGPAEFTRALEERTQRRLTPGKGGRPRKPAGHENPKAPALPR